AARASRRTARRRISSSGRRGRGAPRVGCRVSPPRRDPRAKARPPARRPPRPRAPPPAQPAPPSARRPCRRLRRASPEASPNPPSWVEFHLVEETKHGVPGPHPALQRPQLVVGGLAERPLDREPGEV